MFLTVTAGVHVRSVFYVWPKGADGRPQKEEPVKEYDHGKDAMRYAVAYADGLGGRWAQDKDLQKWMVERYSMSEMLDDEYVL